MSWKRQGVGLWEERKREGGCVETTGRRGWKKGFRWFSRTEKGTRSTFVAEMEPLLLQKETQKKKAKQGGPVHTTGRENKRKKDLFSERHDLVRRGELIPGERGTAGTKRCSRGGGEATLRSGRSSRRRGKGLSIQLATEKGKRLYRRRRRSGEGDYMKQRLLGKTSKGEKEKATRCEGASGESANAGKNVPSRRKESPWKGDAREVLRKASNGRLN